MTDSYEVTDVVFSPATAHEGARGLIGYVRLRLGGRLRLDGLTLRRTASGAMTVSFPVRRDRQGRSHTLVRLLGEDMRADFERQVIAALRAQGALR